MVELEKQIPFHKVLREAIEPLLSSEGFKLTEFITYAPECLGFERAAEGEQTFAQIIFHGGALSFPNHIYVQAKAGEINLLFAEDLIPDFSPSSLTGGGWHYTDESSLQAVIAALVDLTKRYLLEWIAHPRPVMKSPILTDDEKRRLRQDLLNSIPTAEINVTYFRTKGNLEEAAKWEYVIQEKQRLVQQINDELGDQ